jgi:hypothetical protein
VVTIRQPVRINGSVRLAVNIDRRSRLAARFTEHCAPPSATGAPDDQIDPARVRTDRLEWEQATAVLLGAERRRVADQPSEVEMFPADVGRDIAQADRSFPGRRMSSIMT